MLARCGGDNVRRGIDAADSSGRETPGEIRSDRSGPAADVEETQSGPQMRDEIGGRVFGGTPTMRTQNALVMSVCNVGGLM